MTTRRELATLLPALFTVTPALASPAAETVLPSRCYPLASLPAKKNAATGLETRQVFTGLTHEGCPVDLHITTLQPGQMPHPAHQHAHEEIITLQTGTLEVTISGETSRVEPGSVIYVASNDLHQWKNVGQVPSTYFVLATGHQAKA